MPNYVGYHSTDRMGYGADEITTIGLYTSKTGTEKDDIVWVIVGDEGSPKTYRLIYWFVVDRIAAPANHEDFGRTLYGSEHGTVDRLLNHESWFPAFRRRMGNFGLGLTRLDDEVVLAAFRQFAAQANHPAPES